MSEKNPFLELILDAIWEEVVRSKKGNHNDPHATFKIVVRINALLNILKRARITAGERDIVIDKLSELSPYAKTGLTHVEISHIIDNALVAFTSEKQSTTEQARKEE